VLEVLEALDVLDSLPLGIVVTDQAGGIIISNPWVESVLGWSRHDLRGRPLETLVPERLRGSLREQVRSLLAEGSRGQVGSALGATAVTAEGAEVPVRLVGSRSTSPSGTERLVVSIQEVAQQADRERHSVMLERLLAVVADGSDSVAERCVAIVAEAHGWDVAVLWATDDDQELRCRGFWHASHVDMGELRDEAESARLERGVGLPGRVRERGEPIWLPDLTTEPDGHRGPSPCGIGLESTLAFPLRNRGQVTGVVELSCVERREPDPGLIEWAGSLGDLLGNLLHRGEIDEEHERLQEEQQRLVRSQQFLLQAARILSRAGGYVDTLDRLAQVAVPALADLCLIDVIAENGTLERMAVRHADPALRALARELRHYPPDPSGHHPSLEVIATRRPRSSAHMSEAFMAATTRDIRQLEIMRELRFTSYMCVPLTVADRVLGAVTLVSAGSGRRFGDQDLAIAQELAAHAAAVIDRARNQEVDRETVRCLQDAFLPAELPATEHLEMTAAYLPASDVAVGGDWYDVFPLERGSFIAVGDVAGHGLHSVALMAQLRNALRAFATDDPSPSTVLTRLNRMLCRLEPTETATAIVANWDPRERTLRWAAAGHPPPLRCRPGEFGYLESGHNPLLGADASVEYTYETKLLRPGTTLVMFTDGLIEDRRVPIDHEMDALLDAVRGLPDLSPQAVCDGILDWRLARGPREDDICLVAVRLA
jgi:PAS domain S-box-containing protein